MNKLIIPLFFVVSSMALSQDASLNFGDVDFENRTFPILYESDIPNGGFQINLSGLILEDAFGGVAEEYSYIITTNSEGLILFRIFSGRLTWNDISRL